MQFKSSLTAPAALDLSSDGGELVIGGANGRVTLTVSAATTATLTPQDYVADMEMTFTDDTVQSTDTFTVEVVGDVTQ